MELAAYKKGGKTASRQHHQQAPGIEPGKNCTYLCTGTAHCKKGNSFSVIHGVFDSVSDPDPDPDTKNPDPVRPKSKKTC